MGLFISSKNKLRCPKCGRYGDKSEGDSICFFCGCALIPESEYNTGSYNYGKPVVKCPYCQSTDTKKISATSKAVNTAMFGVLGTKRHKQWHCNKCNSDF